VTTNESYKWADLRHEQKQQCRARERERRDAAGPDGVPGPAAEGALPRRGRTYQLADAVVRNVFDNGLLANVREVLCPPSLWSRRSVTARRAARAATASGGEQAASAEGRSRSGGA
jgi:hypothetical protein